MKSFQKAMNEGVMANSTSYHVESSVDPRAMIVASDRPAVAWSVGQVSTTADQGDSSEAAPAVAPKRVILVDDDPNYGFLCKKAGKKFDLNFLVRKSSNDFIEKFLDAPAEVVLIDLDMTDPHGVAWKFAGVSTIIEFRRRFGDAARLWVVTGVTDNPNLISACLKAGADDFIWKDVEPGEICRKIRAHLG